MGSANHAPLPGAIGRRPPCGISCSSPVGSPAPGQHHESLREPNHHYLLTDEDPLGLREIRRKMERAIHSWIKRNGAENEGKKIPTATGEGRERSMKTEKIRERINQMRISLEERTNLEPFGGSRSHVGWRHVHQA